MLPKQARGTSRKHVTTPFTQPATPDCTTTTYLIRPADESKAIPALFSVVEIDHPPYGGQAHEVDVLVQLALAHSALQGPSLAAAAATGIVRARPGSGDAGLPQAQSGGAPHAGETSAAIAAPTVHSGGNCIKIGLPGKLILGDYFQKNMISRRPFLLLRISFPGIPILIQFVPAAVLVLTALLGDLEDVVEEEEGEVGALSGQLVRPSELDDVRLAQEVSVRRHQVRRAVLYVAEYFKDMHLPLGPSLVLVDVRQHLLHLAERRLEGGRVGVLPLLPGGNCIKIGLPGKLILSKRKGLREDLFS